MLIKKMIIFLAGVITTIVILLALFPLFKIFNSEDYNAIALLSLNVGILQALIAIIAIGIASMAYFNFSKIRRYLNKTNLRLKKTDDRLTKIDNRLNIAEENIKNYNSDNNTDNDIKTENML